jgi:hypothetical protein
MLGSTGRRGLAADSGPSLCNHGRVCTCRLGDLRHVGSPGSVSALALDQRLPATLESRSGRTQGRSSAHWGLRPHRRAGAEAKFPLYGQGVALPVGLGLWQAPGV